MSERDAWNIHRRDLLKVVGVTGAAAGLQGCETIVPPRFERRPRGPRSDVKTVCGACPAGCGIAVRLNGADVVGLKGITGHPVNDGGLCPRGQAEIQNLYHPDRLRTPVAKIAEERFEPIQLSDAVKRIGDAMSGSEIVFGVGHVSIAERAILSWLAAKLGAWVVSTELPEQQPPRAGFRMLLGTDAYDYDLAGSDYVLSLECDFLQASESPVLAQRAFARVRRGASARGRVVSVGSRFSVTAAHSDVWLSVPGGGGAELFALSVAHEILKSGERTLPPEYAELASVVTDDRFSAAKVAKPLTIEREQIERVARELRERARAVVVANAVSLPIQVASVLLNLVVGAVGREGGLRRSPPTPEFLTPAADVKRAVSFPADLKKPSIILYRSNPAYTSTRPSGWHDALERAPFVASLAPFVDESAAAAKLVVPVATALESRQLSAGSALDGTGHLFGGPAATSPLYSALEGPELVLQLARAAGHEPPWKDYGAFLKAASEAVGASDLGSGGAVSVPSPDETAESEPTLDLAAALGSIGAPKNRVRLESPAAFPLALRIHVPLAYLSGEGAHLYYLVGISSVSCRHLWETAVELHPEAARRVGVEHHETVWVESSRGRIPAVACLREGLHPDTAAIAFGAGRRSFGSFTKRFGENPQTLVDGEGTTYVRIRRTQ
jgi:anaerobic selenocysteine-containing dehydrogenase